MIFGTDPEFWFLDDQGVAKPASNFLLSQQQAIDAARASKSVYAGLHDELIGKVFFDGYQAEINVPAYSCREELAGALKRQLQTARGLAPKHNISCVASVPVTEELLMESDPRALQWGCNPDYNIYTGKINMPVKRYEARSWREAGGHVQMQIHSSNTTNFVPSKAQIEEYVHALDYLVGLPLVIASRHEADLELKRREVTGRAGDYRVREQKYSRYTKTILEYRTPSSFWLRALPFLWFVFAAPKYGITRLNKRRKDLPYFGSEEIRKVINTCDADAAFELWKEMQGVLIDSLFIGSGEYVSVSTLKYVNALLVDHRFGPEPFMNAELRKKHGYWAPFPTSVNGLHTFASRSCVSSTFKDFSLKEAKL